MDIQKLYDKESKLLSVLRMSSDEKTKDKARRQIEIVNENIKMLEAQSNER